MKSLKQQPFLIRALLVTAALAGQATFAQAQEAAIGGCNPQDFVILDGPSCNGARHLRNH